MKLFLIAVVVLATLAVAARLAALLLACRRVRRESHATFLGRGPFPVGALVAFACIAWIATKADAYPAAGVAFGIAFWTASGLASLLAFRLGTWIHDEGVDLHGLHFSWSGTTTARLDEPGAAGAAMLHVDPGVKHAKPVSVAVPAAKVEAVRDLLARLEAGSGTRADG